MDVRIVVPGRRERGQRARPRGPRAERVSGEGNRLPHRIAASTDGERDERSEHWLKHCEGFQVSGPDGRIGSVALVLSSDESIDGFVIRTGLLRTRMVFVPIDEVASITPRRGRVELVINLDPSPVRVAQIAREAPSNGNGRPAAAGGRDAT